MYGPRGGILELLQRSIGLEGLRDVLGALCFQLIAVETANASRSKASITRRHEKVSMATDSKRRVHGEWARAPKGLQAGILRECLRQLDHTRHVSSIVREVVVIQAESTSES